MKNYVLFLIATIVVLMSCKDTNKVNEGYSLYFMPRKVEYVFITIGKKREYYYQGIKMADYLRLEEDSIAENLFFVSILTSNYDIRMVYAEANPDYDPKVLIPIHDTFDWEYTCDDPIPSVEQQITLDYEKYVRNGSLRSNNSKDYHTLVDIHYCTTEIKSLNISALNAPLFGKPAGESLNDFFTIRTFSPPVIVSAPTERLVYGYSSRNYPTSIDEWLSLSPFGQSVMWLEPNRKMEGLPLQVQFVVQMETADGLLLSDTTRVITIQKSIE